MKRFITSASAMTDFDRSKGSAEQIARELASALDYAHGQDIIHRDIKPDIALLEAAGAVVTDVGIAGRSRRRVTTG